MKINIITVLNDDETYTVFLRVDVGVDNQGQMLTLANFERYDEAQMFIESVVVNKVVMRPVPQPK